jgi:hypothetical protein
LTNFPGLTAKTLHKYPPQSFPNGKRPLGSDTKKSGINKNLKVQIPKMVMAMMTCSEQVPPVVSEVITAMLLSWNQWAKFTLIKQDALYRHQAMETTICSFYMTMTAIAFWQSPSRHGQDKQF